MAAVTATPFCGMTTAGRPPQASAGYFTCIHRFQNLPNCHRRQAFLWSLFHRGGNCGSERGQDLPSTRM